jgi:hypothetical protein
MRGPITFIREQLTSSSSRSLFSWSYSGSLRSVWRTLASSFMPNRPVYDDTVVDYNFARQLYRNDGADTNLGAGFCRPIIDLSVEYLDLPRVTSDDDERDTYLNECIHDYWASSFQQVVRDAIRDSKTVFRFRQPDIANKLVTDRDRLHGKIEVIPPEACQFYYNPADPDMVDKLVITHWIDVPDDSFEQNILDPAQSANAQRAPQTTEHQVIEVVTPERIRFFDLTDNKELVSWGGPNRYGFVNAAEVHNEYDATLGGGQSDLEPLIPFIRSFHDVLLQTLRAHKYHSTPKLRFQIKDVGTFLRNNFPDVLDDNGRITPGASIRWEGREVLFVQPDEDIGFIEAQSVLGDSKTLLEFLIECICIAAEVPKWALMKVETSNDKNAEARPFEKKIERKRKNFAPFVQMMCKMALSATGQIPETVRITWPVIRTDELVSKGQAIQQLIMGFDVATQHHWVADETVISILGSLFPEFQSPEIEKADAADNYEPLVPAQAPASSSQALPAPSGAQANGKGSKRAARGALSTTTASKS